ncbi:MAG: hypothetical protein ABIT71_17935, partial [Vicinamibacteraceae bacterium]
LRRLTREGHTCAAVAKPSGPGLSSSVAVILSKPTPPSAAPPAVAGADVRVVTATADTAEELEADLNAGAAQGFTPCGLTLTAPMWGRPSAYGVVAVLARTSTAPTGVGYRVVRSRARREDWARLERAAADGFIVSRVVTWPAPANMAAANTSEIVFLAEKTATSKPTRYELVFAGNGPALEKDIAKAVAKGYCAQAAWATAERMSVLLAKPIDGPCATPHDYEIEESSRFTVNAADGELLALFRIKDGTMALHDGRNRAVEYSTVEGMLIDGGERVFRLPREHRELIDKLDADGGRGYLPVDVTWRETGPRGMRAIDVILSRPRQ